MDFDLLEVRARLAGHLLGRALEFHLVIDSTNAELLRRAGTGEPEGLVVVADTQTAGRGRRGRTWHDLPGRCLLFSVLLRPQRSPEEWATLSLAGALAAARALSQVTSTAARPKWPNDLILGRTKVGGVLVEAEGEALALGIGVNVRGAAAQLQHPVGRRLTTVEQVTGRPVRREDLLVALLLELDALYAGFRESGSAAIVPPWRELDLALGCRVVVESAGERLVGLATGVDDLGHLLLRDERGREHTLAAGEVTLAEVEE